MDDLTAKLSELLNDPESMNRVKQMAESILGENSQNSSSVSTENESPIGPNEMKMMMNLVGKFKSTANDSRTNLLTALKPHLSEPRQEKVETAIKILKVLELLPLIKESGLF